VTPDTSSVRFCPGINPWSYVWSHIYRGGLPLLSLTVRECHPPTHSKYFPAISSESQPSQHIHPLLATMAMMKVLFALVLAFVFAANADAALNPADRSAAAAAAAAAAAGGGKNGGAAAAAAAAAAAGNNGAAAAAAAAAASNNRHRRHW
jgi:hypothetical protein